MKTKKREFLLAHPRIYYVYGFFHNLIYKIKGIGKSGNCALCELCENKGCVKNRIAKKYKMARVFEAKCFEPVKNDDVTSDK